MYINKKIHLSFKMDKEHNQEVTSDIHHVPVSSSSSGGLNLKIKEEYQEIPEYGQDIHQVSDYSLPSSSDNIYLNIKEEVEDIHGGVHASGNLVKIEDELITPGINEVGVYALGYPVKIEEELVSPDINEDGLHVTGYAVKIEPEFIIPDVNEDPESHEEMPLKDVKKESDSFYQVDEQPFTSYSLNEGIPTRTESGIFKCHYCEFTTTKKSTLRKHIISGQLKDKPHVCSFNRYINFSGQHLKQHKLDEIYEFEVSGKKIVHRRTTKSYEKTNTVKKPFICKECGKGFSYNSFFTVHMRCHTGEKPFKCKVCVKRFQTSGHLRRHNRSHTGEKPFKCKKCGKMFRYSSNLNEHYRSHTGEKPFKCEECGKGFSRHGHLILHNRIHSGERPFKCKECGKTFTCSSNLKLHNRSHTGEKPFKCKECGRGFIKNGHLRRHDRIHTGHKPFKCNKCGKRYTRINNLARHKESHTVKK